jgi:hypothetical protein
MADGPWRCSECGTINEPVANSCRTCGRWPSLFDLESSVVDDAELEDLREPAPAARIPEPVSVEPAPFEPEAFEPELSAPELPEREPYELDEELEDEPEPTSSRRRRQITTWIVPIAFAVYLVISIVFGDR